MNLYKIYLSEIKKKLVKNKSKINFGSLKNLDNVTVQNPPEKFDYDFSSNIAMVLAKKLKENPNNIADKIKKILITDSNHFDSIDIAKPGFLNFRLSYKAWTKVINDILKIKNKYGSNKKKNKFNIEFVSANPTGPLHVGHCRGAVFGDVLSNLLKFNGNKVVKEFYINDYGNQVSDFTKSVFFRLKEIKNNEPFPSAKHLYPGQYIIGIAKKILKDNSKIHLNNYEKISELLKDESLKHSMSLIKSDLNDLGIKHDYFFSETKLVKKNLVQKTINKLKKNKLITHGYLDAPKGEISGEWEKTKRLIFKSSLFGDDTDRALQKNDGSWTYFANDIAYHATKVSKKYDYLVNILGADHTGYIKRISAAVTALSRKKTKLICKVCQLVKLYKGGQPLKMSKRSGDFISVRELIDEVGKDSVRFMMLNRGNDIELDFDFDKVLEKSKNNPVFYIQYSYARINSLFNSTSLNLNSKINLNQKDFPPNSFEYRLMRKIVEWPKVVESASNKLEPHRIPFYLYDLATIFHSYWSKGNEDHNFKFLNNGKINRILTFKIFQSLAIVLENGMSIIGVSLPKKM